MKNKMNRLTQRSQLQRGFVIRDIARAYAPNPSAIYTRKELQEKCKNIILHSGWLRELQHYGILQCQRNGRWSATYSFLPKSKAEFEIKSKRFVGLG